MGKYDAVVRDLPLLPSEVQYSEAGGQKYQEKVDAAKALVEDRRPSVLLTLMARHRRREAKIEELLKRRRLHLEASKQLLVEAMDGENIKNIGIDDVGKVDIRSEPYAFVSDKNVYHEWCLEHGFGPQMQLAWMTTNSVVKEMMLEGKEPPPGVDVYVKTTPVFTKAK